MCVCVCGDDLAFVQIACLAASDWRVGEREGEGRKEYGTRNVDEVNERKHRGCEARGFTKEGYVNQSGTGTSNAGERGLPIRDPEHGAQADQPTVHQLA